MPMPDAQFEAVQERYCQGVRGHALSGWRERALDRQRSRVHFDRGWEFLFVNEPCLESPRDRDLATHTLVEFLRSEREKTLAAENEKFGFIPLFVFAIILKVIVSILIDMWLLQASEATK